MRVRSFPFIACFVAFMAIAFACGSDPAAPRISELRVSPEEVPANGTLTISVLYTDEDSDLGGGEAEIGLLRVMEDGGQLFRVPLTGDQNKSEGTLTIRIQLPPGFMSGTYDLSVTVVDRSARRSNALVAQFRVQ